MCKALVPQVWLIFSGFSVLPNGYGTRVYVRKFVRQGAHVRVRISLLMTILHL